MNYIIVGEKEVIRSIVRVIPREKISYETPSTIGDVELNFRQYWVTSGDVNYILIEFRDHAESADSNSFTVFSKEDPSFVRKVNWNKCDEMSFVAINMLNKLGDFKGLVDLMEMGLKSIPLSGIDRYLEKKEEECDDTEEEDEEVWEMKKHELKITINNFFKYLDKSYPDEVNEEIKSYVSEKVGWMKKEDRFWQSIFSVFTTCSLHTILCDFDNSVPAISIIDKDDSNETKFFGKAPVDVEKREKDIIRSVDDFVDALKNAGLTNEYKIELFVTRIYNVADVVRDLTYKTYSIDFSGEDDAYKIELSRKTSDDPLIMYLEKKHTRLYADGLSLVERYDKLFVLEFEEKTPDCVYSENNEVTEEEAEPTPEMVFLKGVNSKIKPYVDEVEEEMIMEIVKEEVQSFFDSTWVVRPGGRWLRRDLVIKLPDSNVMCKLNIDDNGFIQFGVESNNKIVFDSGKTIKKEYLTCTPDKDRIYYQLSSLGIMDNYIDTFQHSFLHTIRRAVHDKNMILKIAFDIDGKDGEKFELYMYNSKEGVQINITKTSKDRKVQSRMNTVPHRNYVETATEDTYIDIERRYETTLVVTD